MTKICKQISRSYLHNGKVATDDGEEGIGKSPYFLRTFKHSNILTFLTATTNH